MDTHLYFTASEHEKNSSPATRNCNVAAPARGMSKQHVRKTLALKQFDVFAVIIAEPINKSAGLVFKSEMQLMGPPVGCL